MDAQHSAFGLVDQLVMQQALARSYNETFLLLLVVSLATAPAVLLLRRTRGSGLDSAH